MNTDTDHGDHPAVEQVIVPWAICALVAALVPVYLAWLTGPAWLLHELRFMLRATTVIYWGSGLLSLVVVRRLFVHANSRRERVAELLLQASAGVGVYTLAIIAALLAITWPESLPLGVRFTVKSALKFIMFLPPSAVGLAGLAWVVQRRNVALCVGGVFLVLWLAMVGESELRRKDAPDEDRAVAPSAPMCAPSGRIRLTPRRDRDSPTGIYVPRDLEEALVELDRALPACFIPQFLKNGPRTYHHSIGMWVRNSYGLWAKESPLAEYFQREYGLNHPDDMSSVILMSYYRRLRREPLGVSGQATVYRTYWQLVEEGWKPWESLGRRMERWDATGARSRSSDGVRDGAGAERNHDGGR
ncbi:MAG: DUF6794 domain-containing protein [candidate division NC10 bacterium]